MLKIIEYDHIPTPTESTIVVAFKNDPADIGKVEEDSWREIPVDDFIVWLDQVEDLTSFNYGKYSWKTETELQQAILSSYLTQNGSSSLPDYQWLERYCTENQLCPESFPLV